MKLLEITHLGNKACFRFIANRHAKASTIITSNKVFPDWAELFEDPIMAAATLDRMLHRSIVINISGSSYQIMGKRNLKTQMKPSKRAKVAQFSRPKMAHL